MGSFGAGNPFGFELGGGPSRVEQLNTSLKGAVGTGGSALDGTIEAEWRLARARGWASSLSDERAMYQTWPDTADEGGVEVFEELLAVVPTRDQTLQDRRDVVTPLWTQVSSATTPDLTLQLEAIDPTIAIIDFGSRDSITTTEPGRAFQDAIPADPGADGPIFFPATLLPRETAFPNFSQDFILFVSYPLPAGPLSGVNIAVVFAIQDLLDKSLPAWCNFQITTKLDPLGCFILDTDILDLTGLCE
jgi:hypothetical protein